jgi:type IV fimbrial biogenesis protein FimT
MLEMLITGVIIGVLAAVAIPAFSLWYPNYRLKASARQIFSDLQLAKLQAVRANGKYRVVFEPASGRYQIISLGDDEKYGTVDDVVEKVVVLAEEYRGDVVFGPGNAKSPVGSSFGDGVTHAGNAASFDSRGFGNNGYVYLANRKGRCMAIGTRYTGMIVMKKWNDSTSQWE